jgi:hypothetical protein
MNMAPESYRQYLLTAVRAELRPGESPQRIFPAITVGEPGGGMAPAALMPLIMAAEHLVQRRRDRAVSRESLFPLSQRMIMVLSDQRLMIWAARLRWRPGRFLGYVARDRIQQATAPTAGAGWRTLHIYLANEPAVAVKVRGSAADVLAAVLSGAPGPGWDGSAPG